MSVEAGEKAPDFTAPTDGGGELSLSDLKGQKVVLYFYPKDSTPGCTTEANDFKAAYKAFKDAGAEIVGVSKDSVKRHDNFKEKQGLPFPLVSDADSDICERYGVWTEKKMYGKTFMGIERSTFLIGEDGKVEKVWRKVKVKDHAREVLDAVNGS